MNCLKAALSQLTGRSGCAGLVTETPVTERIVFCPARNWLKTLPSALTPAVSSRYVITPVRGEVVTDLGRRVKPLALTGPTVPH